MDHGAVGELTVSHAPRITCVEAPGAGQTGHSHPGAGQLVLSPWPRWGRSADLETGDRAAMAGRHARVCGDHLLLVQRVGLNYNHSTVMGGGMGMAKQALITGITGQD